MFRHGEVKPTHWRPRQGRIGRGLAEPAQLNLEEDETRGKTAEKGL